MGNIFRECNDAKQDSLLVDAILGCVSITVHEPGHIDTFHAIGTKNLSSPKYDRQSIGDAIVDLGSSPSNNIVDSALYGWGDNTSHSLVSRHKTLWVRIPIFPLQWSNLSVYSFHLQGHRVQLKRR